MSLKTDWKDVLSRIPDYKSFLSVTEMDDNSYALSVRYPDIVETKIIGFSRKGRPIILLKIGKGMKHALLYGCPHPNEPIGAMMLEYFSVALAENKDLREAMDYTYLIVKTVDPDGTILNEGWFNGKMTFQRYARNFYRPEADAQVDWTFPIDYKDLHFRRPIPETKALMELIDTYQPSFIYPLHNAGFGGSYWYMSRPLTHLYKSLYTSSEKANIPLHLGEPEMPYIHQYAPAVFKMIGAKQIYDYMEPIMPKGTTPADQINYGTCSQEYAENTYQPFSVMTELPYFVDERVSNMKLTNRVRKEILLEGYQYQNRTMEFIGNNLSLIGIENIDTTNNPFYKSVQMYYSSIKNNQINILTLDNRVEYLKNATVAETFGTLIKSKFYMGILAVGMLYRLSQYEIDHALDNNISSKTVNKIIEANTLASEKINAIAAELEAELDYRIIPIKDVIRVQLETGLLILHDLDKEL